MIHLLYLFLLFWILWDESSVSIRAYPQAVMVGQGVGLTCKVTPHPDNRQLRMGFKMWQTSTRQLEGEAAPITWNQIFNRIPCDPGEAFCLLTRADGKTFGATIEVAVGGCQP